MPGSPPSDRHEAASDPYTALPTRRTVFLRTFLPWQLWRFVRINLKMIAIIRASAHDATPRPGPPAAGAAPGGRSG